MIRQLLRLERVGDQRPGHGDEVVALEFGRETHPVIGRYRVRTGEGDHALDVEADEAVADARAGPRHREISDIGEGALGEHVQQVARAVEIGPLERGGLAPIGKGRLVGEDRDDHVVMTHRDGLDVQPEPLVRITLSGIAFPADVP